MTNVAVQITLFKGCNTCCFIARDPVFSSTHAAGFAADVANPKIEVKVDVRLQVAAPGSGLIISPWHDCQPSVCSTQDKYTASSFTFHSQGC
jgi:hypothetical protein